MKKLLFPCLLLSAVITPLYSTPTTSSVNQERAWIAEDPAERPDVPPRVGPEYGDLYGVNEDKKETQSFQSKFFNMLLILGLLIAAMYFTSWFLKKMMRTRVEQMNTSSSIKLIETRPLSTKSVLYLVEVGHKQILLSESHAGVSKIAEF